MRARRAMKVHLPAWLATVGLVLWIAAPIALVSSLTVRSATSPVYSPTEVLVSVERATGVLRRPVAIELRWASGTDVLAPSWTGLVGAVLTPTGTAVNNGTPVVVIDGITRRAAITTAPFYRSLTVGSTGADVADLNAFLRSMTFDASDSASFTRQTLAAVRSFAASIGVPDSRKVLAFSPGWVVFIASAGVISNSHLRVSAPAPAPGDTIFTLAPALVGAALVEPASAKAAPSDDAKVDAPKTPLAPSEVAAPGEKLLVGDVEIKLNDSRQLVAPESLPLLAAQLTPNGRYSNAVLALTFKQGQWLVPAPAVILKGDGHACVEISENGRRSTIDVAPLAAQDGRVAIEAQLTSSTKVAIYPPNVAVPCRSK